VKLAIVGTRIVPNERMACRLIYAAISGFVPQTVISGGAPGIDTFVETVCRRADVDIDIYRPEFPRWEPDGYKLRNIRIAEDCDVLVCIRSREAKTFGSGWTANEAERIGKTVYRWEMP